VPQNPTQVWLSRQMTRPFPGRPHPAICYGTETNRMVRPSVSILPHVLMSYFQYHHRTRTHLSPDKDCPQPRPIQPPAAGKIVAFPRGGRSASSLRALCRLILEVNEPTRAGFGVKDRCIFNLVLTHNGAQNFHPRRTDSQTSAMCGAPMNSAVIICSPIAM
jgi:hypothetical protein